MEKRIVPTQVWVFQEKVTCYILIAVKYAILVDSDYISKCCKGTFFFLNLINEIIG